MRQQVDRRTQHYHDREVDEARSETSQDVGRLDDLKHEMDEILDEIDEVLEENAEEFVKGYVQKGGE